MMSINASHEQTASYSQKPGIRCHFSPSQCVPGERSQKRTQYLPPFMKQASALVIPRTITSRGSSLWKKLTCASALSIPMPRSEHVLMVEALVSSGTEDDRKRSLLSAIVTGLQAAGVDPNDIIVPFGEIDRTNSSFGGGRPALPVEQRPNT
jgi:hypothetical protein